MCVRSFHITGWSTGHIYDHAKTCAMIPSTVSTGSHRLVRILTFMNFILQNYKKQKHLLWEARTMRLQSRGNYCKKFNPQSSKPIQNIIEKRGSLHCTALSLVKHMPTNLIVWIILWLSTVNTCTLIAASHLSIE